MIRILCGFICILMLQSCQKQEIVFDPVVGDNFKLPLLLRLDGKDCAFDVSRKTLKYAIDENSLSNFAPYIEHQPFSEITFESINLVNESENLLGSLKLNEPYQIKINTGEETNFFNLIFTEIPIIQIVLQDPIVNEPKTLSRLTLNYPNKEKESVTNWIGIEHRGASTLKYDKKSLGIRVFSGKGTESPSLKSYFDLKPNDKWILDAMFTDDSRLRNKVSFDLWNSLPGPVEHIGIKSRFVEVYINYKTHGLYNFSENYTTEFLDLNSQSVLYTGWENSKISKFDSISLEVPNNVFWAEWEQKLPNPSERIVWDDFKLLSELIVRGSDSDFKNKIADHIDLDNVIDYFLFINLLRGADSMGKNWHFLKREPSAKFTILPWDMDATWGRSIFKNAVTYEYVISNGLFTRLQQTNPKNYNERLKKRWKELKQGRFAEENLIALFTSNFDQLGKYKIIDLENDLWKSEIDLESEQNYIITWLKNRLSVLEEEFGD